MIEDEVNRIKEVYVSPSDEVNDIMKSYNTTPITTGISLEELIRRPELDYNKTASFDKKRKPLDSDITEQVENMIKYEGYIARQIKQVEQYKKMEGKLIPEDIDYNNVGNLRLEAIQKLNQVRPSSIGQASRISGVSPADISVLLVYVKSLQKE